MKLISCLLLTALFVSCAGRDESHGIQNIVNQWTNIEMLFTLNAPEPPDTDSIKTIIEASEFFYQSFQEFQTSDLYRIYRAISFLPQTERTFNNYSLRDIEEVGIVLELALVFRDSIVSGDVEKARAVSPEISRCLIRLLIIDGEAQRHISSSYFNLLIALLFFIAIIALLICFLHQSLTRSIKTHFCSL